jgi:hypothetical protein
LRKRESSVLLGERREEEGLGSIGSLFLYHLELGGGETLHHHLVPFTNGLEGGTLGPREGEPSWGPTEAICNLAGLKLGSIPAR